MEKQALLDGFKKVFGRSGQDVFFSPGRINLIGEHTDYNNGLSMPCAISLGTYGVFAPRNDDQVELYSQNIKGNIVSFPVTDETPIARPEEQWANYFKGMLTYLRQSGYEINNGFSLYVYGNLPYGAGLSSSASIEMLMGEILKDEYNIPVSNIQLARLGQRTENKFLGLKSGIMDQFAVRMGKKNNAVLLNSATLSYQYKPMDNLDYILIIMSTNKKHSLANSAYNDRVKQCHDALQLLQQKLEISSLSDLDFKMLEEYSYLINNPVLIQRVRHVVTENARTQEATHAIQTGDMEYLGRLINASHVSLAYDYEVSSKELDTLVNTAWQQPGVAGARMIGGGFAGSAIALVKRSQVDNLKAKVSAVYRQKIGYDASFYDVEIVDGPRKLD